MPGGVSATPPRPATATGLDAFAAGFFDAVVVGCVAVLIVTLAGCQKPQPTSPGLEAAGANAATLDGTLDTIGYHAEQLRKEFK